MNSTTTLLKKNKIKYEFIANKVDNTYPFTLEDIIGGLQSPSFSSFRNIDSHLESFYDNLVIKKYRNE